MADAAEVKFPSSGKQPVAAARPIVALGTHSAHAREALRIAAADLGAPLLATDASHLPDSTAKAPLAFVVSLGASSTADACLQVRLRRTFAHVPIIALADEPSDLHFSEIFSIGGDDVAPTNAPERLRARLRALSVRAGDEPLPAGRKGVAIVAGVDSTWRAVLGRVIANGGYQVQFAIDASGLNHADAKLIVTDDAIIENGGKEALSTRSPNCACVVLVAPKRITTVQAELAGMPRLAVTDAFAPPENVLFLANELGFDLGSRRASARLLYGTSVSFRLAGRETDEVGFSYNLSAGGLYIRTLAPLDSKQEVWLELWPPRSDRRVRLVGSVVWRRAYGQSETATVPPGFGVQLQGGLGDDLARYTTGYNLLSIA